MPLEGDDSLEDTVSGVLSTGSEIISNSGGGGGGGNSSSSSSSDHTATDIETANAETKLREQLDIASSIQDVTRTKMSPRSTLI